MADKKIFLPKRDAYHPVDGITDYQSHNKDYSTEVLFADEYSERKTFNLTDRETGNSMRFSTDISSKDDGSKNMSHVWKGSNSHAVMNADVKLDHYLQKTWGNYSGSVSSLKQKTQVPMFGVSGIFFGWSKAGSYWSIGAVYIKTMALSYINLDTDTLFHCKASRMYSSDSNHKSDKDSSGDKNGGPWVDAWKISTNSFNNYVKGRNAACVGVSMEFRFKSEGGASHNRYFKIYNMNVIYDWHNTSDYYIRGMRTSNPFGPNIRIY